MIGLRQPPTPHVRQWAQALGLALLTAGVAAQELPRGDCAAPRAATDLRHCDLTGSLLNGAHLRGASFLGSRLTDSRFVNAVTAGADFSGALEMPAHLRALLGAP